STASATAEPDGTFTVRVTAADIGTGARTVLTQIAADALGVAVTEVRVLIGDSAFGPAMLAGGAVGHPARRRAGGNASREVADLVATGADIPAAGLTVRSDTSPLIAARPELSRHAYGAHFVEVEVDVDSGEIRVPRMVGVFAAGRIVNPLTARSQLI